MGGDSRKKSAQREPLMVLMCWSAPCLYKSVDRELGREEKGKRKRKKKKNLHKNVFHMPFFAAK